MVIIAPRFGDGDGFRKCDPISRIPLDGEPTSAIVREDFFHHDFGSFGVFEIELVRELNPSVDIAKVRTAVWIGFAAFATDPNGSSRIAIRIGVPVFSKEVAWLGLGPK